MHEPALLNGFPPEQIAILERCRHPTGTYKPFDTGHLDRSIPWLFERRVEEFGNRPALLVDGAPLTYAQLNRNANRLAHALLDRIGTDDASILHLVGSFQNAAVSTLAILKTSRPFVPLSPSQPIQRLSQIATESGARWIVTDKGCLPIARQLMNAQGRILCFSEVVATAAENNPGLDVAPDKPAWLLYTSGSTGRPKGVVQTHRSALCATRNYTDYFRITPEDRVGNPFTWAVNAGTQQFFSALLNGAAMAPFDLYRLGTSELDSWLSRKAISLLSMVPCVFRQFATDLDGMTHLPNLRLIYLQGEAALRTDFELYRAQMPDHCIFLNRLGSTEADWYRGFFADKHTRIKGHTVPVGYPIRDKAVLLVDEEGDPVEGGEIGEMAVRSGHNTPGYWRHPGLNEKMFFGDGEARCFRTGDLGRMEPDGCMIHLGRKDFQVQIRGQRVELAEIEGAMLGIPGIRDAAATTHMDRKGMPRLAGYFVLQEGTRLSAADLRQELRAKIPDYMVPAPLVRMDELPHGPNGKIDRRRLPAHDDIQREEQPVSREPRSATERWIVGIWQEVLEMEQIGVDDDFLDLGGDSLQAMRIVVRVRAERNVRIDILGILECGTVAAMARLLDSNAA